MLQEKWIGSGHEKWIGPERFELGYVDEALALFRQGAGGDRSAPSETAAAVNQRHRHIRSSARPDAEGHESRFDCRSHPERRSLSLSMMPAFRRVVLSSVALAASRSALCAQELTLPLKPDSVRFAAIGDMGAGKKAQYELAGKLSEYRQRFACEFVITLGDNLYGGHSPSDYEGKFERPYKPLLDAGVLLYATLGNHDKPNQRFYKPFNMNGHPYYTYKKGNGRWRTCCWTPDR